MCVRSDDWSNASLNEIGQNPMRNLNEVVNYRMLQMETTLTMAFIMSALPAQSPFEKLNQVTQFMPTILNQLYSHFHGYFTMRLIPLKYKVIQDEVVDASNLAFELQLRKGSGFAFKLLL